MKKLYLLIILGLIIKAGFTQSLSIEETVNYLNKISKQNPSVFNVGGSGYGCTAKQWREYTLNQDGTFIMESYRSYENCVNWREKNNLNREFCGKDKFNINDIILTNMKIEGKCFYIYDKWNNKYWGCNTDDDYTNQKIYNAYIYLFSQVQLSKEYKRNDDDPFAPNNFNIDIVFPSNQSSGSIILKENGGVYITSILIGTLKFDFILDSGAGEVNISSEVEQKLINAGIITKSDYLVSGLYQIADGSIIMCRRVLIKKMKIGGIIVSNVVASVGGSSTPLLLGRSFLNKFKKWSINNTNKTLELEK